MPTGPACSMVASKLVGKAPRVDVLAPPPLGAPLLKAESGEEVVEGAVTVVGVLITASPPPPPPLSLTVLKPPVVVVPPVPVPVPVPAPEKAPDIAPVIPDTASVIA